MKYNEGEMKNRDVLFLLGGKDLEMLTIEKLLVDFGFQELLSKENDFFGLLFVNKNLEWGANIKDYKEYLDFKGDIYGIELTEDENFKIPHNYHRIDHHNEKSEEPSSLEQVIKILFGKPLNEIGEGEWDKYDELKKTANDAGLEIPRFLKLVAANDKGYIPAMIECGAGKTEIDVIRKLDRQAQDVTQEDERLAEKSINQNLETIKGVTLIKSFTSKFSAITDRLYPCASLLVYTDDELTYYGINAHKLKELPKIITSRSYYGGKPENGFWGISGIEVTEKIINKIISLL